VDEDVDALVRHLERAGGLTCFMLSDHGFDTVGPRANASRHLVAAGLKASDDSTDVLVAGCSVYVAREASGRVGAIAAWLLAQPWISGVFARDDLLDECPGALPQSAVGGGHARSAELMFSYGWSDAANEAGVPGTVHGEVVAANHGSTSPYCMRNTLVAWGQGIKRGLVSRAPCGIVDVAPTVLHLLGIARPPEMQGRVLEELLEGGLEPDTLPVTRHMLTAGSADAHGGRQMVARYATVCGHRYLEQVSLSPA
jgi:arylsulfatase A-like enzyme